jgi:hypothetical protein
MDISTPESETYCPVMQHHIKNADLFAVSFSLLCITFDSSYDILALCMTFGAFINVYGSLLSQNFLTFALSQYVELSISGCEI